MRFLKVFISVAIGCGFLLKLPHLSAQGAKTYPVVSEVRVEFNGFQSVSEELVLGNVQLRAGMDYNAALVDQSIRTLYTANGRNVGHNGCGLVGALLHGIWCRIPHRKNWRF